MKFAFILEETFKEDRVPAFVEAFHKGISKQLLKAINAQDLQDKSVNNLG